MAASAWKVYNETKKYLENGTIDLDTNVLKIALYKSSSNVSTFTLSAQSEFTNVVNAAGYTGAKTLGNVVVTAGASASSIKFDASDVIFTASGADVTSIMYAAIYVSGGKALCWSKLSSSVFSVTSGNTLTVQFNSSGIWTLSGGTA